MTRVLAAFGTLLVVSALGGCGRGLAVEGHAGEPAGPPPTFTRDIAPIVFSRCASCHRPGQSAPFSLLTYEDVRSRAEKIVRATGTRRMPPWLPDSEHGVFVADRRLAAHEIAKIERWAREGSVEGDPADLVKPPEWTDGWQLRRPDLVVEMPKPYTLQPGGHDVFRNFVVPVDLPQGRFVRAVEFRPGNAAVVHHAVISIDRTRASRRRDGADGTPGYDGMVAQGAQSPDGHFLGWTPGRGPIESPADMPWRLERGADLVVQLHLLPGKTPATVRPTVGLFFTDWPPAQTPLMIKLGSKTIEIPAGARRYEVTDSYVLPVHVTLLSVYPHAHYLGDELSAEAVLPGGEVRSLIRIPHWNFHWQQDYRYKTPVTLPRGTTLRMRFTYDNSDENPHNPHRPSQPVFYGPGSHDEMGDLWLQVLPASPDDAGELRRAFQQREAAANVAGAEMLVRRSPDEAANQVFLGSSYLDVGRAAEAVPHFEQALRRDPRSADAANGLGGALWALGRPAEAAVHFTRAAALDPKDDRLLFNLANVLSASGRADEASRAYRRALVLNPDFAEAHNNLGVLLQMRGAMAQAVVEFEQAVTIRPDYADAHNNLGAALAGIGEVGRATEHVRRALALDPAHPRARENLARLVAGPSGPDR